MTIERDEDYDGVPPPSIWGQPVTVELTIGEAHYVRAAAHGEAKRRQRNDINRRARGDAYAPPPGKENVVATKIALLKSAKRKLSRAVRRTRMAIKDKASTT